MKSFYKAEKKKLLWGMLFFALLLRVLALLISDNFHGIAAGKIFSALRLIVYPNILEAWIVAAHGPVHMYILALVLKIFKDPFIIPRLISLIMGEAFLIVYFYLLKRTFNEVVAFLSLFVASFFSLLIVYSVLSTAETTFLFFLFSGLLFFEKFKREGELKFLFSSAFFISCSSLCRFEGGMFIVIVSLFLIKERRNFLLFFCTASILPLIWMLFNYLVDGNGLFFLTSSDSIVATEFNFLRFMGNNITFTDKMFYWLLLIKDYFGWPVLIIGIIGAIFLGYKKERIRRILFLFLALLLIFSYKTVREELAMQPRYGITLGVLFIPFFSLALIELLNRIEIKLRGTVVTVVLFYVIFRSSYLLLLELPHSPEWVKQAGVFLRENVRGQETVFVDSDEDNEKDPIKIYANIKPGNFIDFNPFPSHTELIDSSRRNHLKYIVLISRKREFKRLEEVFRMDKCKIYKVKNSDEKRK